MGNLGIASLCRLDLRKNFIVRFFQSLWKFSQSLADVNLELQPKNLFDLKGCPLKPANSVKIPSKLQVRFLNLGSRDLHSITFLVKSSDDISFQFRRERSPSLSFLSVLDFLIDELPDVALVISG